MKVVKKRQHVLGSHSRAREMRRSGQTEQFLTPQQVSRGAYPGRERRVDAKKHML
ncbi:MAG: hypothetical protein ACE5JL_02175 [Dehalococcoidia bacterium]